MECSKIFPIRYAGEAGNMSSSYWRETEGPKFCHLGKVTWQCSVWLLNPKIVLNYMPLSHSRNDKTGTISIMPQYWNHYFRPMFEKNAFQKYLKSLTLYDIDNSGKETNRHKVPMLIFSMQSEAGLFGCRWLKPLQTVLGPKGGTQKFIPPNRRDRKGRAVTTRDANPAELSPSLFPKWRRPQGNEVPPFH